MKEACSSTLSRVVHLLTPINLYNDLGVGGRAPATPPALPTDPFFLSLRSARTHQPHQGDLPQQGRQAHLRLGPGPNHQDGPKSLQPNPGPVQHIFGRQQWRRLWERLEHTPDANLRLCFSVLSCFTFLYKFSELG